MVANGVQQVYWLYQQTDENMKLTKEQYDALDESLRAEFEQQEDGSYINVDSLKVTGLKTSLDKLDSKMKAEKADRDAETQRLVDEARETALEEAKSKNNIDEVLRIEREKLEDEKNRITAQREELTGIKQQLADDKLKNTIDNLANHVVKEFQPAFKVVIKQFIDVSVDSREVTYLNEDGSASSLNKDQFIKELADRTTFAPMMKGKPTTTGGGLANGGMGGGAASKKPNEMTSAERIEFKQRDPAGFKQAFNL